MSLVIYSTSMPLPQRGSFDTFLILWAIGAKGSLFGVSVSANFSRGVCSTLGCLFDRVNSCSMCWCLFLFWSLSLWVASTLLVVDRNSLRNWESSTPASHVWQRLVLSPSFPVVSFAVRGFSILLWFEVISNWSSEDWPFLSFRVNSPGLGVVFLLIVSCGRIALLRSR